LRAAFLVSYFPLLSETFILDQITGLLERGCEVEIFADEPAPGSLVHPEVDAWHLTRMTHLPMMPRNPLLRPFRAIGLAAANLSGLRWAHARSLNFMRYGFPAASLRLFFETDTCVRQRPFDIIHCHFGPNGLRGLALRDAGALRGKLITSFYGYDVSEYLDRRRHNPYTKLFEKADLSLAISQLMRRKLMDMGCDSNRAVVHRLGVNPNLFIPSRRATGEGPVRILTIGRMVEKKGIEYGLRAIASIAPELPRIEYLIIGDGPLKPRIEKMVEALGLREIVRLAGWKSRPEVVSALGQSDILLAPSLTSGSGDQEGTPVVILEAMASALPVVSTLHAGIPEVVENGVSGFLVPEKDGLGLAGALKNLIRNPELRAGMGQCGRSIIEDRHDIGKLNHRLLEIYRELVAAAGH
jgi:colanic acid/amylovoran biosynthesis glycosyltransferase